ncbi:MAG: InlB B-repeat-containing protein [Acutalibacteraceae bacterium]|nr:InlB B-repeat-containing protein [Acutalibacteraceae bacterium]
MKKRVLSLLLVIVFAFSSFPFATITVSASASYTEPTIVVESKYIAPNSQVEVKVDVENNPGVAGATLGFSYDPKLTLVSAKNGDAFAKLSYTAPGKFTNPCEFFWDSATGQADDDGTILYLTFKVSDEAVGNDNLNINVSYYPGDIYNEDFESLKFQMVNGCITVIDYIPGDVNGDGVVTGKDITLIRRNIVSGYETEINESAADVNDDGRINGKDINLIRRFIVGGYGVELSPSKPKCEHAMSATAYNPATCTKDGNIAYWYCSVCDKYFSDAEGTTEITLENTVIPATDHTVVVDPAVPPTYESTGLTEGSHCSNCNEVFVKQEIIPILKGYSIEYNIANGDMYLAKLGIDNSANPTSYNPEQSTIVLKELKAPDGYKFLGWFDGAGENANRVMQITKGSTGNKQLYAHWHKEAYEITFASDMVPVEKIVYTTDREIKLPSPKLDKYTFVGWTDKEGNMYDIIPVGSTGDINLYANWASNRNRAVAVDELKDPIILEDSKNGLMLFTYEIGKIENVPLFTTMNLNCVNGIITEHSKTEEKAISNEKAETVAQTISNATTNSTSWTLSKNWSDTTEVSESYLKETGQERQEAETLAKSQSSTYNIGMSFGGSNTTVDTSSGAYKISGNQSHSTTNTTESGQNFGLSVDNKNSSQTSFGGNAGLNIKILKFGINANNKDSHEVGKGVDYSNYVKHTNSGTDSWSNDIELSGERAHSVTDEKTWNASEGFSSSNSVSASSSVSNTISTLISQQYGYGKTYSEGGSNSEAQDWASTDSKSDEFSSTLTYYTSDIESTTTTFTSTGNTKGDYRLVMAGDVHVFAVVGYDVAKKSYFVYTYNVLDDTTEEYLDYSFDGTFDDYETSIIPFEVPSFVNDYVNNRIAITNGLSVNRDKGMITRYTAPEDGPATVISVPSYVSLDNGDGTFKSVKITDISPDLFRNNKDIVCVILGHNIKKIPDNAFEGCTSLKYVICQGVTEIGSNAFKGCTSLNEFVVSEGITSLGNNAFEGVPQISAVTSNEKVALAVASSGADNIVLDISKIPQEKADKLSIDVGSINRFELLGKDKEYKELSLKSDAKTTIINGVTITEGSEIPIDLSSENVTLNRVKVKSSGYAMLLGADITNVTLNGTNTLSTESGNTLVCRNIRLSPLSVSVDGEMNVSGKILICGAIEGTEYITYDDIVYLSEEKYLQYQKGVFKISFNANGGNVETKSIESYYGAKLGALPTPTRENCTFEGWFTEDGTQITEDTIFTYLGDLEVRARWLSGWVLASNVPADGEVVNAKWNYTLREHTANSASELFGWVKYDTQRTSWGAWSGWSTANPSNGVRNVESRSVYDHTEYHYYRWTNGKGYVYSYKYSNAYWLEEKWFTYILPTSKDGSCIGYVGSDGGDRRWVRADASINHSVDRTFTRDIYHTEWRYQEPIYTYYYYRDLAKESTTDPTGQSNVSNVVKWVQYRVK